MTEVITPSSHWQGTPAVGSRWSVEQLSVLARQGVADPENARTATVLRWPRENLKDWTMPPEPIRLVLPRLALTRDRKRAKVVTPAGAIEWINVVAHG